jgi:hypothetical protein
MRFLTAFVTVFVLGFGSAVFAACPGHMSDETTAQKTDRPWLPPDEKAS